MRSVQRAVTVLLLILGLSVCGNARVTPPTNTHASSATTSPLSSWSITPTPMLSSTASNFLDAVFCLSATVCTAVGNDGGGTLVETWNGSAWVIVPSPNPTGTPGWESAPCSTRSTAYPHRRALQSAPSTMSRLPTASREPPNPAKLSLRFGTAQTGRSLQPPPTNLAASTPSTACRRRTALRLVEVSEPAALVDLAASHWWNPGTVLPGRLERIQRQQLAASTRCTAYRRPSVSPSAGPSRTRRPCPPIELLLRSGTVRPGRSLPAPPRRRTPMEPNSTPCTARRSPHALRSEGWLPEKSGNPEIRWWSIGTGPPGRSSRVRAGAQDRMEER